VSYLDTVTDRDVDLVRECVVSLLTPPWDEALPAIVWRDMRPRHRKALLKFLTADDRPSMRESIRRVLPPGGC